MITAQDELDLVQRGKSREETEMQLQMIAKGFAPSAIRRAATINDGIIHISDQEAERLAKEYDNELAKGISVAKFVPASGAASRMFKPLHQYAGADEAARGKMDSDEPWSVFFRRLSSFAFAEQLERLAPNNHADIVKKILDKEGLAYAAYPKGLVAFHKYTDGTVRTAAEEHIAEAKQYCMSNGKSHVHYTVPVGMEDSFRKTLSSILHSLDGAVEVSFSIQPPSTDVPALTLCGEPARDSNGHLIFRPGGHGALIGNLAAIDADAVFVKNIDNVSHGRLLAQASIWKKVLAAYGLKQKRNINAILKSIDEGKEEAAKKALEYIETQLRITIPDSIRNGSFDLKKKYAIKMLDKPLRVCGMVKNEGEPGGGPFWVEGKDGNLSLQIVESAQMDINNVEVDEIVKKSTHFNPVDLFCCLKDRNGKKYNLADYVDPDAGFLTQKSVNGVDVVGMELPGLWNGAMANWLTFFVEVPILTFTPVKTVMDLLRPAHQME